jgi:hypothetical protein
MSRSLILAGLLVDSWRDQSPQTEPSEKNLQHSATQTSQPRGTSDDVPSTPRLTSLIAVGAIKWDSR